MEHREISSCANRPLVSVVVPVYNVAQYLDQCLESVAAQTYSQLQVIVVDDGSTDESGSKCDSWLVRDSRFSVVHQENRGLSAARNIGLDRAIGDYVVFVDADDYVAEHFVESLLAAAIGLEVNCVMCGFVWVRGCWKEASSPASAPELVSSSECLRRIITQKRRDRFHIDNAPWNRIYARSLFEENGIRFPEGRAYEGTSTMFPLTYHSGVVGLIPDALYMHRVRAGSIMQTRSESNLIGSLVAAESFYFDVALHYPDLARVARAKMEQMYISSCLSWLDDAGEHQRDAAGAMSAMARGKAVRNWRDLQLPADAIHLAALIGLLVSPQTASLLYQLWRKTRGAYIELFVALQAVCCALLTSREFVDDLCDSPKAADALPSALKGQR